MKTKHLLFSVAMLLLTALSAVAQDATNKHLSVKDDVPFGKRLPAPGLTKYPGKTLPQLNTSNLNTALMQAMKSHDITSIKKTIDNYRQQVEGNAQIIKENASKSNLINPNSLSSDFHLTKDINALAESNPSNYADFYPITSYAQLKHIIYFAADDGIHGNELWRSDGTDAGTFMVMDIESGSASSDPYNISAVNGKLYFTATTSANGKEPWVSDGTESGTHILMDIKPGGASSWATDFTAVDKNVYFVTDGEFSSWGALWATDGTTAGTRLVKSIGDIDAGGYLITQLVSSNGLLFFTFFSFSTGGIEVWRSDGTPDGTYHVGTNYVFYDIPLQLTDYDNKLYFSSDDGSGRKLWVSDGTDAGTTPAPGNNDVWITTYSNFSPFPILDNVLYLPGYSAGITLSNALFKYNAANNAGVVLVKDFSLMGFPAIDPLEMKVVNNTLYFRVVDVSSDYHNELWRSKGTEATTHIVHKFLASEYINNLYSGNGSLYFINYNKQLGSELWKLIDKPFATFPIPESDIFKGRTSSFPAFLTAFKGKLFFTAADGQKGNELFMTTELGIGATIVKDINTTITSSSYAGLYVDALTALGSNVIFNAFERRHGTELYKSDGTEQGTLLLKDILPGEKSSNPGNFVAKNNSVYFTAINSDYTYSIFKTNGTTSGFEKLGPDYNYIQSIDVADNGILFYAIFSYTTYTYELWRSDGTAAGTYLLSSTLYYASYLNVAGNTAFFVAGDGEHGYELWKSDGSVEGTKLVKDINPSIGNSNPGGMFAWNNEVYFGAYDGVNYAFFKSDGTEGGTIQLHNIDPWYGYTVLSTERQRFEVSNNMLYFSAINYSNTKGTQLWKTDGTPAGTQVVKDISPDADGYYPVPVNFTDVNGTVFFVGDDGVHGVELWKTDGTKQGTELVKDILPGLESSYPNNLVSFAGKLYFSANGYLWSSDGTKKGTMPVDDSGIKDVVINNIVAGSNQLFISGYSHQYGYELYAGKVSETGKFTASKTTDKAVQKTLSFNAVLYPNPAVSNSTLQITGNTKTVSISITDMSGKKLWQGNSNAMQVKLPTEKLPAGSYVVTVTSDTGSKTIKLVKQ